MRRVGLIAAIAVVALAAFAGRAQAADECAGLLVCLPFAGPWVVVAPPSDAAPLPRTDYDLRCPRRGYIVAGTDVRLSDRGLDVSIRGDTGSPVSPGVTVRESALFVGVYVGNGRRATAYRPFIGCVPTSGGGGRARTARAAEPGLKPTRPLERRVVDARLSAGANVVRAQCGPSTRLVGGSYALAFRGEAPPSSSAIAAVSIVQSRRGDAIVARARVGRAAVAANPELQVLVLCARVAP